MQTGFYNTDMGYWETRGAPPAKYRAKYPAGTVEVPLRPTSDHVWTGAEWQFVAPAPIADADRTLSPPQFAYLLALTGFDDVWAALEANLKGKDRAQFAALKAERARSKFRLDLTLGMVAQFRAVAAQIAPEVDLSETAIRTAWDAAEAFKGVG